MRIGSAGSAVPRSLSTTRSDSWLMGTPLAIAVVALGLAIQNNNGAFSPAALLWVTIGVVGSAAAVLSPTARSIEKLGDRPIVLVLSIGLAVQLGYGLTSPAGVYLAGAPDLYDRHHFLVAAAAVLAGAGLSFRPWLGRLRVPLLLAIHFALGVWLIKASPSPHIDVYVFHQEAYRALSHHIDPYSLTMPNIYGHTVWYAEGSAVEGRLLVGFLYPPLSLLFAWPGHALGDYRYSLLVAMTLSGAFLAYARPGRVGPTAAAVFLFTPRGLLVLEQGWTEPFVVLLASAVVFCACRAPKMLSISLGLLLAVKQYSFFFVPIAPFLLGPFHSWKRVATLIGKATLVAAVVTLPFAMWHLRGFIDSVILYQARQPFRTDALSYMAWTAKDGVPRLPQWASFAVALLALVLSLWRAPRTPAGFAAASAFVFVVFFAFAKQAFCNYYFLVLGLGCCALATLHAPAAGDRNRQRAGSARAPGRSLVAPVLRV